MARLVTKTIVLLVVLVAVLMVHGSAAAELGDLECKDGRKPVGDLGIAGMSFKGSMSYNTETGEHKWYFQAEPKIRKVDPKGPAAGKLRPGDVIVAIDGMPITTHGAGQRFGDLLPGESVSLSVRRKGRVIETSITAKAVCPEDSPMHIESFGLNQAELELDRISEALESLSRIAEIEIPYPPEVPVGTRFKWRPGRPLPPTRFEIQPRAWFGMSITCDGCTITRTKKDETLRWSFDKPPKIRSVEPGGPADAAGLEPGDVLTHVDGVKIDSKKGSEEFSALEPGDTVTWTVKRDGKKQTVRVVAMERPEKEIEEGEFEVISESLDADEAPLRFTGSVGGAEIEVRGDKSVRVISDDGTGEIIILTRGAKIRLRPSEKASVKKSPDKKD